MTDEASRREKAEKKADRARRLAAHQEAKTAKHKERLARAGREPEPQQSVGDSLNEELALYIRRVVREEVALALKEKGSDDE